MGEAFRSGQCLAGNTPTRSRKGAGECRSSGCANAGVGARTVTTVVYDPPGDRRQSGPGLAEDQHDRRAGQDDHKCAQPDAMPARSVPPSQKSLNAQGQESDQRDLD